MTIAVDFDGCLCENKWPDIGKPRWGVIQELKRRAAGGDKLILWTCREGNMLQAAILWCLNRGLKFDAINDNLPENKEKYGNNCRKVWADEYWDDKSVALLHANGMYATVQADEKHVAVIRDIPGGKAWTWRKNWTLKGWWRMLWRCG